ncbi:hypothetical protein HY086_04020 [Candidatus Gottesmanbacteria bacterium]|nr:hypothetical protein [Candidatus Gottesmanbacteria bacterium]
MNKIFSVYSIGLIGIIIVLSTMLLSIAERPYSLRNVGVLRKEIDARIKKHGAPVAYKELVAQISKEPSSKKHTPMHVFGEVLYSVVGISGIGICDASFGFGCFHGLFGKAVAGGGVGIIDALDKACIATFGPQGLGCPHGIGHGLGEYFGPTKLLEQLATCATLSWKGTYHGCQSGVFMEYDYPTVVGEDSATTSTRQYKEADSFSPCFSVPKKFQQACFFELPAWWWDTLSHDVKKMGTLCDQIQEIGLRESCFLGIGAGFVPRIDYVLPATIATCHLMPNTTSETLCRAGAGWAFFANPVYRPQAQSVCGGLSIKNESVCISRYQRISIGE